MTMQPILIGTRGSRLALAQADAVRARIARALGGDHMARLEVITTSGDRIQDRTLTEIGGKGLFTLEIEQALLSGRIQCAIHSLKDMPAEGPPGLTLAAIPEREDARDAFLSVAHRTLAELPAGARLGTASLRRQAQSLHDRPDLGIVNLRGNVDTRIAKMAAGEADAILLAMAGLNRLGLAHHATGVIDPVESPPAPGQGALAIQTRIEDADAPWLDTIKHRETTLAVAAERGALVALEGSCKTAIGAYATIDGSRLTLIVEALTPRGESRFRRTGETEVGGADGEARARALGLDLGRSIHAEAGDLLFA
jgi:hydroxymethylbilane synthase